MTDKPTSETLTVAQAIRFGYAELIAVRKEVREWQLNTITWERRDNRDRTRHLEMIYEDLKDITPPDIAIVPNEVMKKEVCATVYLRSKSRETRKDNALARLRPAVAALRRAGLTEIADKIAADIERGESVMYRIPGAYE